MMEDSIDVFVDIFLGGDCQVVCRLRIRVRFQPLFEAGNLGRYNLNLMILLNI